MERLTAIRNGVTVYVGPECKYDTGMIAAELSSAHVRLVLEHLTAYEDTGLTPEEIKMLVPLAQERTYIVTELCPHCMNEVEMRWDTDYFGFKAFCPVCGECLMLCDECRHTEEPSPCDYGVTGDGCWRNPSKSMEAKTEYELETRSS